MIIYRLLTYIDRYAGYPVFLRNLNISMNLPNKTVREVALRLQWMVSSTIYFFYSFIATIIMYRMIFWNCLHEYNTPQWLCYFFDIGHALLFHCFAHRSVAYNGNDNR